MFSTWDFLVRGTLQPSLARSQTRRPNSGQHALEALRRIARRRARQRCSDWPPAAAPATATGGRRRTRRAGWCATWPVADRAKASRRYAGPRGTARAPPGVTALRGAVHHRVGVVVVGVVDARGEDVAA